MFQAETKILIVDDVQSMREYLKTSLKGLGFSRIDEADSGEPALNLLEKAHTAGEPFQLILADWHMEGIDGFELLKRVKAAPHLKPIPFILITAEGDAPQVIDVLLAGASNYLLKPIDPASLKSKLAATWAKLGKAK